MALMTNPQWPSRWSVCQWPGRPGFVPRSCQWLKKWYLIPPCLILSIIRYISRVKWTNQKKGVVSFPTPQCNSYCKGSLWVALHKSCQLYLLWFMALIYSLLGWVEDLSITLPTKKLVWTNQQWLKCFFSFIYFRIYMKNEFNILNDNWSDNDSSNKSQMLTTGFSLCCGMREASPCICFMFICLFVCVILWHTNLCRLFNVKSIFIQINSSISYNSIKHKFTV